MAETTMLTLLAEALVKSEVISTEEAKTMEIDCKRRIISICGKEFTPEEVAGMIREDSLKSLYFGSLFGEEIWP